MLELDPQRRITVAAAKEPSGLRGAGGVNGVSSHLPAVNRSTRG